MSCALKLFCVNFISVKCPNWDIFFAIDGSLSIRKHNFERIRQFLKYFVIHGNVSVETNHVGLLQFSEEENATIEFGFSFQQQRSAILRRLQLVRYHAGKSTFLGAGLKIVLDLVSLYFDNLFYNKMFAYNKITSFLSLPMIYAGKLREHSYTYEMVEAIAETNSSF